MNKINQILKGAQTEKKKVFFEGELLFCSRFGLDSKSFSLVHTQSAGTSSITIAFRPVFLAVAGFTVDLIHMHSHCCAVQTLPADHLPQEKEGRIFYLIFYQLIN